ncbi:MAG: hypothetical protein R6V40_00070 [Candidatus Moraniibacteriota bacterium]
MKVKIKNNHSESSIINKSFNQKKTAYLKRSFFIKSKSRKGVIKMKKYLGAGIFVLASAVIAIPALAGACHNNDDDCNGDDSELNSELKIENSNRARVMNNVDSYSNTGNNQANRNSGIGRIETGSAYADAMAQTEANENRTVVECNDCVENIEEMKIKNRNSASVTNNVESVSNTGNNQANANEGKRIETEEEQNDPCEPATPVKTTTTEGRGDIKTGDASSVSTAFTMANSNVTRIR